MAKGLSTKKSKIDLFRDQQRGLDWVKNLPLAEPDKKARYVVCMNDVYQVEALELLFSRFATEVDGALELTIVISRLTLAADFGVDLVDGEAATVWYREGDLTYTQAVGSNSQYIDRVDCSWMDYQSGEMPFSSPMQPCFFVHKPEKRMAPKSAAFVSILKLTTEVQQTLAFGFPLSDMGVVIDREGIIPILMQKGYEFEYSGTLHDRTALARQVQADLKSHYGRTVMKYLNERFGFRIQKASAASLQVCMDRDVRPIVSRPRATTR
jgi:hypothetical protein